MRRSVFRSLLSVAFATGMGAAETVPAPGSPPLPPLRGELSGDLVLPKIPGLPPLAWHVRARPAPAASLAFDATASAPGLELRGELTLPVGDAPGTWRLAPSTVDAAAWWRLAADQAGPGATTLPGDLEFAGALAVTGSGEWRGRDFSGTLHLGLAEASARSAAQGWSATGLTLDADIEFSPARVALRAVQVRVATLQAAGFVARDLLLAAVAADGGRFAVTRAAGGVFGGHVSLAPFTLDPVAPAVNSVAEFSGVALGELAALVPHALKEAQGRVAGRLVINWSVKSGLGPGDGALAVSSSERATVLLAASPGLLTGRSPPRIDLLPEFMGPLRRWFSFENPAHGMLQRIELGQAPLAVESLRVQLYPDGAGGARSAQVEVVARPTGTGDVLKKITFTVNVSGPLDQVLRLGLDDRAKIRVNAAK